MSNSFYLFILSISFHQFHFIKFYPINLIKSILSNQFYHNNFIIYSILSKKIIVYFVSFYFISSNLFYQLHFISFISSISFYQFHFISFILSISFYQFFYQFYVSGSKFFTFWHHYDIIISTNLYHNLFLLLGNTMYFIKNGNSCLMQGL